MSGYKDAKDELSSLHGGLVVSCQAREGSPLHGSMFMTAMALSAVSGGAVGIRADGPEDIRAIRKSVDVPIIGILKVKLTDGSLFITPSEDAVRTIVASGSRLVALDGTGRSRPGGQLLRDVIAAVHAEGACALADVSTDDEGWRAVEDGADAVGTTLSGYTPYSFRREEPDLALVERLAGRLQVPVFAEGRITTPVQARQAFDAGAAFVVVGTAITDPAAITRAFVRRIEEARQAAG